MNISLYSYGIGVGDAVFIPNFTFFATAEVVALNKATPIFVDVYEDTFNLDCEKLEIAINKVKNETDLIPKAIISVDLFGLSADYDKLESIAQKYNLILIEDAAQGFGGSLNNRKNGGFGNIATTSFFPAKPLGCYGDGGAIFTNDNKQAELIRSLCVHGKGQDKYDNVRVGFNSRLDTIQAGILQVKFKAFVDYELDDINKVASWYDELLQDNKSIITPKIPKGYTSSYAQYTIKLKNKEIRENLQQSLKQQGIPSMIYYAKTMHMQTAFSGCDVFGDLSVSTGLCDCVLALPIHPYMVRGDVDRVVGVINDI